MIVFKKITYKNILSVGQAPLEFDLTGHRLTALYGSSGSGKSLFLDAISFALFGRAFRDINKADLINSINGKALLVELDFSIGDSEYQIRRGLKPTVFEILLNGSALNQDSHAKDQQKYLEDQILKMNWRIFTSVVMLGAANYTPFMRLKPNERKKMVENILGISVFSTMNALVKTKISDEVLSYKSAVERNASITKQSEYLETQQRAFELKVKEEIDELTQKLLGMRAKKKEIDADVELKEDAIKALVESFNPKVDVPDFNETFDETFTETFDETFDETFQEVDVSEFDVSELVNRRATRLAEIKSEKEKIEHIDRHLVFYRDNDSCPTCTQKIEESFKTSSVSALTEERLRHQTAIEDAERDIASIKEEAEIIQAKKKAYSDASVKYKERKKDFESRRSLFESRRRAFEDRQRLFEAKRRAHEERLKKAESLLLEKRRDFERDIDAKKEAVVRQKQQVASLIAEAKFTFDAIEEKKKKPLLDNTEEISRLRGEIESLERQIDQSGKRLKLLREVQIIIKDDGVKTEILKRYVPTLNNCINKYLLRMGMFLSFELDQEFNDTIRSRHRDVLSYANYSEGERQRLDLAVLLAWRHLAQAQSAVNTNLLVLDEVLDSYLDQSTTETILSILRDDEFQLFNIIIISHKDGLSETFDRTLQFHKKNNFTCVV